MANIISSANDFKFPDGRRYRITSPTMHHIVFHRNSPRFVTLSYVYVYFFVLMLWSE